MRLILIRHAPAEPRGTERDDGARALTAEGARKFRRAADGLARLFAAPQTLFSSPLVRARQTAELAASAWGEGKIEMLDALAEGDAEAVEAALARFGEDACVALVGHEPFMSDHLARWLGAERADALPFKKGGVAVVDFDDASVGPATGCLFAFLPPKALRAAAGSRE